MKRDVILRLMDDCHQDKWYGNPFQYLLDNWATNKVGGRSGAALVEAANETYDGTLTKAEVEDLAVAHDCWVNIHSIAVMDRHTDIPMDREDFLSLAKAVEAILAIGAGAGRAKELCRQACQSGDAVACKGPAFLKDGPT